MILNSIVYDIYIYIIAIVCKDKALYLLKFAGLTKVQLKNEVGSYYYILVHFCCLWK